ncbi:MAG: hypothetical protein F6J87_19710 [Spirulina sp. SIO3F2]|nr:hypothetical protein [Spirulina sp. SIO3F2]
MRTHRPNQSQAAYQLQLMGQRWTCHCGCPQFQSITTSEPGSYDLRCSRCDSPLGFLTIINIIRPP